MNTQKIVDEVIEALEAVSSPDRVELSKYYFPTSMRVIGSTNPDAKEVIKGLKAKKITVSPKPRDMNCKGGEE